MAEDTYTETTSSLARQAGVLQATLLVYAKSGLVQSMRLPNGNYLFKPSAVGEVREIYTTRMARRGGRRVARASA